MPQQNAPKESAKNSAPAAVKPAGIFVYDNLGDSDHIRIDNLQINLPGRKEPLIGNVNLQIPRGARVLVTGESGSGKTTLVKAMLGLWNRGAGEVSFPAGLTLRTIPQNAYFPNLTLRAIMNMKPEGHKIYKDRALRDALHAVNLGKLVQHIPGQQVEILMDDLLDTLKTALAAGTPLAETRARLDDAIATLVPAQFDVVQDVRPAEQIYLKNALRALTEGQPRATADTIMSWTDELIEKIDLHLAEPLRKGLEKVAPIFAAQIRNHSLLPYTPSRAARFADGLRREMDYRMNRYLNNEDTEDPSREVRLSGTQAAHVIESFVAAVEREVQKPDHKNLLRQSFNAVSLPFRSLSTLFARSTVRERQMKDLMFNIASFMEAQILRGDRLLQRLSGGQQKMLMAACIILDKPDILLLDEVPSGLDAKNGLQIYGDIMKAIPKDATVISIIHQEEQYVPFHTHHLRVANGGVTMTALPAAKKPAPAPKGP